MPTVGTRSIRVYEKDYKIIKAYAEMWKMTMHEALRDIFKASDLDMDIDKVLDFDMDQIEK